MKTYQKPVCRGSWALGTACGHCERCQETRPPSLEATAATAACLRPGALHFVAGEGIKVQASVTIPADSPATFARAFADLRGTMARLGISEADTTYRLEASPVRRASFVLVAEGVKPPSTDGAA